MNRGVCALVALALGACSHAAAPRWFKGNTHTHTLWSDGDAAPEEVVEWYKSRGYDFLVLSDHNILSEGEKWVSIGETKDDRVRPEAVERLRRRFGDDWVVLRGDARQMRLKTLAELRRRFEEPGKFLLIQGEEITDKFEKKPVHHNSINQERLIEPPHGGSVREVMERTIAAVEAEARRSGRPILVHLNHPNFEWGIAPDDVAHVLGERYFEVYNGHSGVRNYGDADHPGTEALWDYVLTMRLGELGGPPLLGLATDDAHNYSMKPRGGTGAQPGRGWIMVRAASLEPDVITRAMLAGDFYATSGVRLEEIRADAASLGVKVAAEPGVGYTIRFIGRGGKVLLESSGVEATYRFAGDELYVRATIVSDRKHPNGYREGDLESAWVQPVVVKR
jgi:hypothetical protein